MGYALLFTNIMFRKKKLQIFGVKYGTIRHIYALSITRVLQNCFIALNFVGLKGDYAGSVGEPYISLVTLMVEFVADSRQLK